MEWNESEIAESLAKGLAIADDVVPERAEPGPGSHGTLSAAERDKYRAYVESKTQASEWGQELLAACRTAEPVSDEGHESYEDWRQRNPGHEGKGAGFLARLWRATRRKS